MCRRRVETPAELCNSSVGTLSEPAAAGRAVETTNLLVSAPVGQETMHSPQETQFESPIG